MLKDMPFYEVSCLAKAEARQAHLNVHVKKRQERTLRQAPGSTSRVASNPAPPASKEEDCHLFLSSGDSDRAG